MKAVITETHPLLKEDGKMIQRVLRVMLVTWMDPDGNDQILLYHQKHEEGHLVK
jgi:hypothetical protein